MSNGTSARDVVTEPALDLRIAGDHGIFPHLMKIGCIALASLVTVSLTAPATYGQATSVKRITRGIVPPPASPPKPAPVAPAVTQARSVVVTAPPREKSKEEKDEVLRKTIEFQKKSAAEGSASSQYDLGMRYLNGDGLEKNSELAIKWLKAAADQDHTQAKQQLKLWQKK